MKLENHEAATWGWGGAGRYLLALFAFKPKVPGQNDGATQSVGLGGRRQLLGVMGERRGEREIDCLWGEMARL